jgi:hypothetical protein
LISNDFKFFFVHIPKCGGTSVNTAFSAYGMGHLTANEYKKKYPDKWKRYKTFTIIRNPYDYVWSLYSFWSSLNRRSFCVPDMINYLGWRKYVAAEFSKMVDSFDSFLDMIPTLMNIEWNCVHHFKPQSRMIYDTDNSLMVDRVARLESIDTEWDSLMNWLGCNGIKLPHTNKRVSDKPTFTRDQLDKINNIYQEDFELLGYEMK